MTNFLKLERIVLALILLVATIFISFTFSPTQPVSGSVSQGSEYSATTTVDSSANKQLLRSVTSGSSCVVGSVVVASSTSDGTFTLKNATSTTDTASTTLVTFGLEATEGTYTFDFNCSRGLIIETNAAFDGTYYTTYR